MIHRSPRTVSRKLLPIALPLFWSGASVQPMPKFGSGSFAGSEANKRRIAISYQMRRFKRDNLWPSPARSRASRTLEVHRPSAALPTRTPTPRFGGANFGNSAANRSTACSATELGPAMDIRRVAALIGCSPWTVRQRLIPMGLPHLQFAAAGRLIFYRDQVIRWIESKQKGG
jgi:hypothetical protein